MLSTSSFLFSFSLVRNYYALSTLRVANGFTFRYAMKRKGSDIRSFFSGPVDKRVHVEEPSKGPSQPLSSGNVPVQFENVVRME